MSPSLTLAEQYLLLDAANLTVLLLGISLFAGLVWHHVQPIQTLARYGRVPVQEFGRAELAISVAVIFFLYLVVRYPGPLKQVASPIFLSLALCCYLIGAHKDPSALFGVERHSIRKLTLFSLLGIVVITAITMATNVGWLRILELTIGKPAVQDSVQMLRDGTPGQRVIGIIAACILAPVTEEILFRGFLYPSLKRYTQPAIAAVVVSGIFAVIHFTVGGLVPLFVLAILLVVVYELTANLLFPVLIHAGFNLFNVILLFSTAHA